MQRKQEQTNNFNILSQLYQTMNKIQEKVTEMKEQRLFREFCYKL